MFLLIGSRCCSHRVVSIILFWLRLFLLLLYLLLWKITEPRGRHLHPVSIQTEGWNTRFLPPSGKKKNSADGERRRSTVMFGCCRALSYRRVELRRCLCEACKVCLMSFLRPVGDAKQSMKEPPSPADAPLVMQVIQQHLTEDECWNHRSFSPSPTGLGVPPSPIKMLFS